MRGRVIWNLKSVRRTSRHHHWVMDSNPETFKGLTTIMIGDYPSQYEATLELTFIQMTLRDGRGSKKNPSEIGGTYMWMNILKHL